MRKLLIAVKQVLFGLKRRPLLLIPVLFGLTLPFLLRYKDDGHHAKIFYGRLVLDIDRSGFPGGDRKFRIFYLDSSLHLGHGQFSVSFRPKNKWD